MQRTKKLGLGLAIVAVLSGCVGAEVVHLAYQATVETFTIQYRVAMNTKYVSWENGFDAIQHVTYKRNAFREESKCAFEGVLVPWERNWEQRTTSGGVESVLPPEPGEIAGYAAVIYSKKCPEQPEEKILHTGPQQDIVIAGGKAAVVNNMPVRALDLFGSNQDLRPQWVSQVVERATKLASSNRAAKSFIVSAQDQLADLLPEQASAIKAAAAN